MIQVIPFNSTQQPSNNPASNPQFHDFLSGMPSSGGAGEANGCRSVVGVDGVFRNLDIALDIAPGAGDSYTFTLRVNGVDTALTGSISDAATTLRVTGVDVAIVPGDVVSLKAECSGTPTAATEWRGSIEFESTNPAESLYSGSIGLESGTTRYLGVFRRDLTASTTADPVKNIVPTAGAITALYGNANSAPTSGNGVTVYINLNGVRQDGAGGTVNTALNMVATAAANATFSLPVVEGDIVYLEIVVSGTGGSKYRSIGVRFAATVDGESIIASNRASLSTGTTSGYWPIPSQTTALGGAGSEAFASLGVPGPTGFGLTSLSVQLVTAPGATRSRTFVVRKNGADTALSVTIANTDTHGQVSANVDYVDGDTFSLRQQASSALAPSTAFCFAVTQMENAPAPPVALDDAYSTPLEVPLVVPADGVLDNDTGDVVTLTAVLDTDVSNGTLALAADGSFTYTPDPGFVGLDTFTYHASDANGDSNIATVTITVTDIGGGNGPSGTNPSVNGNLATTLPIVFVYIRLVDGTVLVYSQADLDHLSDRSVWYGGKKKGKIITFSPVRRRFSKDGGFQAYPWSIELDDQDSELRIAARARTLKGAEVFCFVVDDSVRRAEGVPFKFATGIITHHDGSGGMTYTLYVEGALARRMNRANMQAKIPPGKLNDTETPGIDKGLIGQAGPVALGMLSDSTEASPEGVVRALYMGTTNLQTICGGGAVSVMVDAYLLSMGAAGRVYNTFYEPPVWGDETVHVLGDLVRPADDTQFVYECTTAGTTDTSEPAWPVGVGATVVDGTVTWTRRGALTSFGRYQVPLDAYGVAIAAPYMPNWTAVTGLATNYVDWGTPTRRYTPVFVLNSHRYARAIREGRIILTANMAGQTDLPDGTGLIITSPERQITFLLANQIFHSTDTWTSHNTFPTFTDPDGTVYSVVDVDSFETQRLLSCSFLPPDGYVGAALLGRGGQQQNAFDVLREFCQGSNLQLGENHHGQIIAHRHNPLSSYSVTFTEQDDLRLKDGLDWSVNTDELCNAFELRYGFRYADTARAGLVGDAETWVSGLQTYIHTAAVNAVGERLTKVHDFYTTRHSSTAWDVALRHEQAFVGTLANSFFPYDGQKIYSLKTRWQGVSKGGVEVDLGVTVGVLHMEGITGLNIHRMTIEEQIIYPLEGLVHNIGPILDA